MNDQRASVGTAFHSEDARDSFGIERIRAESIDGFRGKRYRTSVAEQVCGTFDSGFVERGQGVAYTAVDQNFDWNTWIVSLVGREPRLWLKNASGLSWTDPLHVLFSEMTGTAINPTELVATLINRENSFVEGIRLPNVEDPRARIDSFGDRPAPVGFGSRKICQFQV